MSLFSKISRAPGKLFGEMKRRSVFGSALREFQKDPIAALESSSTCLQRLIAGWGNPDWGAPEHYLRCALGHAASVEGPTLECGSGLTTILLGIIADRRGMRHWALEHNDSWGARVRKILDKHHIRSVNLVVRPLRDYGEFLWYDPPLESMQDEFHLVVCDGPPGTMKGGRRGLLPVLGGRFHPHCIILLDDVARREERLLGELWSEELGAARETLGGDRPFMRISLGK